MSDHFIGIEQAENDLLDCAAFIGERVKSGDGHAAAINAVLPLYLAKGNVDLAAELANAIDDPFSRDRMLIAVSVRCAEIDDDEYAMQLTESIDDHGMRSEARERIAIIKAEAGDIEKAAEIGDTIEHPDRVFAAIASKQAASGETGAANSSIEEIDFAAGKVSAMLRIANESIAKGSLPQAVEWLDQASEIAEDIEHDEEKIRAIGDIGNLYVEAKRNDKAIETFDIARGHAEKLDNFHKDAFLANSALGFLYAGSSELAGSTLELVDDKAQSASAMVEFAREYWKGDEKEKAVELLDDAYFSLKSQREADIRDSRARNGLLAALAVQYAGFGKTERGIEIALENPDPDENRKALIQIIRILIVQNEHELAHDMILEIDDEASRVSAYLVIAEELKNAGDDEKTLAALDEASSMVESVPQLASRSYILNQLARQYHDLGSPEKSREAIVRNFHIISEVIDESSQAAALAALSETYEYTGASLEETEKSIMRELIFDS